MVVKFIRASEIAGLAGMNPYEPQEKAVEKFRSRIDRKRFMEEVKGRDEEPDWMKAKKLCEDQRFKGIVHTATATTSRNTEELKKKQEIVKQNLSSLGDKATIKEKALIQEETRRKTNTSFGTDLEDKAREKWSLETGKTVFKDEEMYRKEMFKIGELSFELRGKIDGMIDEEPPAILEIKCRASRLFREVRKYEMVQVQAYCFLLDCNEAYLVEVLKGNDEVPMDWKEITRDEALWDEVCKEVEAALTPHFSKSL